MGVVHSTVATTPDDGTSEVGSDEWNADHTIENGTITPAMVQGSSPSSANFWRGDGTWATPNTGAGSDLGTYVVTDPTYGATGNGSTDDRAAIQSAVNACISGGGGIVWFPPGNYRINSTTTNSASEACGINVESARVWLQGPGRGGAGRSGNGGTHGIAEIGSSTAMHSLISFDSASNSPDWRGGGISGLHLSNQPTGQTGSSVTGSANIDCAVDVRSILYFMHWGMSVSHFRKTGHSYAGTGLLIRNSLGGSPTGEPTQYGRTFFNDIWNCNHGIRAEKTGAGTRPSIPDWQFGYNSIMAPTGNGPAQSGSTGIYINSNAVRIFNNEIQFWDKCIEVDCASNGFGRHITIKENHFEPEASADPDAYEAMIKITNPSSAEQQCILIVDNEGASVSRYADVINIGGTNVQETRIRNFRIRDTGWITSGNQATYVTTNGATVDIA